MGELINRRYSILYNKYMAYVSLRITSLYLRTKSIADKALKKLYKICNFVITCILKVGALLYRVYCGHFKINEIQN